MVLDDFSKSSVLYAHTLYEAASRFKPSVYRHEDDPSLTTKPHGTFLAANREPHTCLSIYSSGETYSQILTSFDLPSTYTILSVTGFYHRPGRGVRRKCYVYTCTAEGKNHITAQVSNSRQRVVQAILRTPRVARNYLLGSGCLSYYLMGLEDESLCATFMTP